MSASHFNAEAHIWHTQVPHVVVVVVVCVYVCMHACMYVCMYVSMYVYVCVCWGVGGGRGGGVILWMRWGWQPQDGSVNAGAGRSRRQGRSRCWNQRADPSAGAGEETAASESVKPMFIVQVF